MTIFFAEGVAEAFEELPRNAQRSATESLKLISAFPRMYARRRRGVMRGYRYFVAGRFLVYYSISGSEIRISAIIPAAMRGA